MKVFHLSKQNRPMHKNTYPSLKYLLLQSKLHSNLSMRAVCGPIMHHEFELLQNKNILVNPKSQTSFLIQSREIGEISAISPFFYLGGAGAIIDAACTTNGQYPCRGCSSASISLFEVQPKNRLSEWPVNCIAS